MNIQLMGIHIVPILGGIKNNSTMNILVYVFGVHMYAFLLGIFLGQGWLDYRACVYSAFADNVKHVSKIFVLIDTRTQCLRVPNVHIFANTWY